MVKSALRNPYAIIVMALVVLKGIQKEGTEYLGMMAPLGAALDDEKLAAVMTYVRGSFGNKGAAVTKEDAAKYREQWKDIKAPVTRAKIAELSAAKSAAANAEVHVHVLGQSNFFENCSHWQAHVPKHVFLQGKNDSAKIPINPC